MNIRDLQYLVALADYNHFGKAAEACFVSQPALSMQIKKLEEYLGIQLLERGNKSLVFTESGLTITERARQILNQVDEVRDIANATKDPFSGEINIGIFPTIAPYLLPHIIPSLAKQFPRLSFFLIEEKSQILIQKLKQGTIHIAILALPVVEPSLTFSPLFEEEFLLALPHTHIFAKRKMVSQEEIVDLKLLLLEEGHCMRDQVLSFCHQPQTSLTHNFRATSLETLRHMIAAGAGATLMPKLSAQKCKLVSYIPFKSPKPIRSIGMAFRASTSRHILFNAIEKHIRLVMQKSGLVTLAS